MVLPFSYPFFLVTLAKEVALRVPARLCPPCAISLSPPPAQTIQFRFLFSISSGSQSYPASPSCSLKCSPPPPYLLHVQAPQQTFLPAPSREAFLPLPASGFVRKSAMRLFLGDHLLRPDANSRCQLRSGTARLQEGSRHDFYCLRFYLEGAGGSMIYFFIVALSLKVCPLLSM